MRKVFFLEISIISIFIKFPAYVYMYMLLLTQNIHLSAVSRNINACRYKHQEELFTKCLKWRGPRELFT